MLDGYDVTAVLKQARGVGVAELVEGCVLNACAFGHVLQASKHFIRTKAISVAARKDPS